MSRILRTIMGCCLLQATALALPAAEPLKLLFLGDNGHHQPRARASELIPALEKVGIQVDYTDQMSDIQLDHLKQYSGLIVYANIDEIGPDQESALLEYVAGGGGFIPLHCASFCFRNSPAVVDLIGAQFQKHGGEVFVTEVVQPNHPIMQGYSPFESWDETYIHTKHNERNRIVLEVRKQGGQADGKSEEPWTWVRTHGKGRVFYTAWGHDARTFTNPGFHNLIERGVRWACGDESTKVADFKDPSVFAVPSMTEPRTDVAPFEFEEVGPKIPNYLNTGKWGEQGEVITTMQKPLAPAESMKHYVTPEGFHLELFVSEPEIQGKPIAMNWDHLGRLWLCETVDYPNELMPPEQGRDRIRICEDTDGDGKADKFTVFAEKLSIPTSLEFCHGGVVVQAGVETLFLRDNDGDGKADQRDVLISGWAMGDTHGGVSNFQYGLDNRYWAMQGYNNSRPKFAGGQHRGFRQGPFNFSMGGSVEKPVVEAVEFVRSTTNNSWGLGSSEEGLIFASTANRAPSFFVPVPNRYYERVRGWTPRLMADEIAADHYFDPITDKVRQVDQHGGYTAGAGHALYTARTYPQQWWNRTAFVCGPTGHLVGTFVLKRDGATFKDSSPFNLVASDDEWAAPIMAEVGPDGNMWIIDWYNYIIQHNPTPQGFKTGKGNAYESDLRDKTHGRIYRLVYDGDEGQPGASDWSPLQVDDPENLVSTLKHPNRLWRRHAQRLLVERGELDVVPALVKLVANRDVDEVNNNAGAVHALWTLHGLCALADASGLAFEAAAKALSHPAAGVRRNAALVLPAAGESVVALVEANIARDADAQVQLGALMALADMPSDARAGEHLSELAKDGRLLRHQHLRDAVIFAAAKHSSEFLPLLLGSQVSAARAGAQLEIARVVAEHSARSGLSSEALESILTALAAEDSPIAGPVLEGLAAGWQIEADFELSEKSEAALVTLLQRGKTEQLGSLLRLGQMWGSKDLGKYALELSEKLYDQIESNDGAAEDRVKAAREYVSLMGRDEDAVDSLVELISPQLPPAVASGVVRALGAATADNVGPALLDAWSSMTPTVRTDVIAVLIARPTTTMEMLKAMESGDVSVSDLSLDQRQTLSNHPEREVRELAASVMRAAGSNLDSNRQKVIEAYVAATHDRGDAVAGKQLFIKNCAICHKHSGEGKEIGPDLTGMAVHPKEELLIHILDPSRSVEGNFRRYTLLTADGQVLTGMLAAESLSAVEIIDAEGKRNSISREDIDQLNATAKSMMPEGFEQQMNVSEMTDLLEFLTSKGKFVPLPMASVATAVSDNPLFHDGTDGPDQMIFSDWGPKEFKGVPFQLIDPQNGKRANIVLLNGPNGSLPPKMPKSVSLPCNMVIKNLHLLSGVSGWGFPYSSDETVSMIVRIHYEDGETEDHDLINGVHFADYIRKVDVPKSEFAFSLRGQQLRYLTVQPKRQVPVLTIDLVKGPDASAPMVMAVTAESPNG